MIRQVIKSTSIIVNYYFQHKGNTMQKKAFFIVAVALICVNAALAGSALPDYYPQSDFLTSTPGVRGDAAGGLFNPAVWGLVKGPEIQYYWNDLEAEGSNTKNWALGIGSGNLGFSIQHWDFPDVSNPLERLSLDDYSIGLGIGDLSHRFGIGYSWSRGDVTDEIMRDNTLSMGLLNRPCRYISYGFAGHWAMNEDDLRGVADVGVRPLANPMLTIFADAAMGSRDRLENVLWAAGASIEPLPGIELSGKMFKGGAFQAGVSFSVLGVKTIFIPHYDKDRKSTYNTYGVRVGLPSRSIVGRLAMRDKFYLELKFDNEIKYQRFKLFDRRGHTLMELLDLLEEAKNDDRISGIVMTITEDMYGSWELIWEVREKIREVQAAGKKVVVFFERGDMRQYYLASVADKIMVDPEAMVTLMGFNMGRTYYRNMLDKIGVGVDEWRLFKYKSAFESISRTSMSDADREQRSEIIKGFYDEIRADICSSRNITHDEFDYLVNNIAILDADSLLAYKLVDTTGRPDEMPEFVKMVAGGKKRQIGQSVYLAMRPQDAEWGNPPQIAVIYALGPCAMNYGINARRLRGVIKRAREDDRIKAVVLRADSPGGDILPSDIVAEELKKTAEKKPVIVSQGFVAGSGGYWISMYGDKIVASPWTITGSIGVIGGWLYNDGLGDKLGLTYDNTQVGDHADLTGGIALPFLGVLPDRNLNTDEREAIEKSILKHYDHFVTKVAAGRNMEKEDVQEIAQGRVWTGRAGLENGLVDELGGMETAIAMAKDAAGLKPSRRIEIAEMPNKGLINPAMFQPSLLGIKIPRYLKTEHNPDLQYLKFLIEADGRPIALTPPSTYVW